MVGAFRESANAPKNARIKNINHVYVTVIVAVFGTFSGLKSSAVTAGGTQLAPSINYHIQHTFDTECHYVLRYASEIGQRVTQTRYVVQCHGSKRFHTPGIHPCKFS